MSRLHSSSRKRIPSFDRARVSVITSELNHMTLLLMTYCSTLILRGKQETLVRPCTIPNIYGLAEASHFRAWCPYMTEFKTDDTIPQTKLDNEQISVIENESNNKDSYYKIYLYAKSSYLSDPPMACPSFSVEEHFFDKYIICIFVSSVVHMEKIYFPKWFTNTSFNHFYPL